MKPVGRDERRVLPRDRRDVHVPCSGALRLLGVDGVEAIDLRGDLLAVATLSERRYAPVRNRDDDHALPVAARKADGALEEHGELLSVQRWIVAAVLVVDADQQRD